MTEALDGARGAAATLEILDLISRSREDAQPVFDAILQRAVEVFGVQSAALVLGGKGDTHQRLAASFGVDATTLAGYERGQVGMEPATSAAARAIVSGTVVQVETGTRTELSVPLVTATDAIGAIILLHAQVRPFTAEDIALVEIFAAEAVIALDNAAQSRELRKRQEREAAMREILQVIAHSRADEGPVFATVLEAAARLCEAPFARLYLVDDGQTEVISVASLGARSEYLQRATTRWPLESQALVPRAIVTGKPVHIRDLADTDAYRAGDRRRVDAVNIEGIRTFLAVPLIQGNRAIGAIGLYRREVKPFDESHIALVETFAAQAVIAIENVRQLRAIQMANTELQTRLEREKASAEILEVISHSRDVETPVFDAILGNAIRLCEADTSALFLGQRNDARLTLAAWRDKGSPLMLHDDEKIAAINATELRMDPSIHFSARVIHDERMLQVPDMMQSESYLSGEPSSVVMAETFGVRTALFVPLMGAQGALGVVHVYRSEVRPFKADEIELVETFAAQAVIAIENVRQFRALEALNAELGDRVQVQVGEIERMERLKRFLPAAVADTVISSGSEKMLSSHRALLGVLFCDIRGFTAFCETAEPEETIEVLQTYHEEMGRLIEAHGAGVDHRMGDGIMVLFNDPIPCEDPAGAAVRLGIAMRDRMAELCRNWKKMGHRLGFGVGVSLGYATVGIVGSGGRFDYTASGTAINLASRLGDEAQDGEILLSPRARIAVEDRFVVESRGEIELKGIREPVEVFRLTGVVAA